MTLRDEYSNNLKRPETRKEKDSEKGYVSQEAIRLDYCVADIDNWLPSRKKKRFNPRFWLD